jgi:hypothetical protein
MPSKPQCHAFIMTLCIIPYHYTVLTNGANRTNYLDLETLLYDNSTSADRLRPAHRAKWNR